MARRLTVATLLIITMLGSIIPSRAQQKAEYGKASVLVLSAYSNSETVKFEPIVSIIAGNDTIRESGQQYQMHRFDRVPVGKHLLLAEAEGFVPVTDSITIRKGKATDAFIKIEDRIVDLSVVVVKGHAPALVYHKDTLVFSPDGMNFADEDKAREVLKRMPGVEFDNGTLKIGGQPIQKVYVDGSRRIFGTDMNNALDHVEASNVQHIQVYDEVEHPEETNINRQGQKQKVVNIQTKNKIFNSMDAVALAGGGPTIGHDVNGHKARYAAGGTFNFFSDEWLMKIEAMHNNQNRVGNDVSRYLSTSMPSQQYTENTIGHISLERSWNKSEGYGTKVSVEYDYDRDRSDRRQETTQDYFTTQSFSERSLNTTSDNTTIANKHSVSLGLSSNIKDVGSLDVSYRMEQKHTHDNALSLTEDITDGKRLTTSTDNRKHEKNVGHKVDINANKHFGLFRAKASGGYDSTDATTDESRDNTYGTTITRVAIDNRQRGNVWNADVSLSYDSVNIVTVKDKDGRDMKVSHRRSLGLGYKMNIDNRRQTRYAENLITGDIDAANTYSYRSERISHDVTANASLTIDKSMMSIIGGWRHAIVRDLPQAMEYDGILDAGSTLVTGKKGKDASFNIPVVHAQYFHFI